MSAQKLGHTTTDRAGVGLRGLSRFLSRALRALETAFLPAQSMDIADLLERLGRSPRPALAAADRGGRRY